MTLNFYCKSLKFADKTFGFYSEAKICDFHGFLATLPFADFYVVKEKEKGTCINLHFAEIRQCHAMIRVAAFTLTCRPISPNTT